MLPAGPVAPQPLPAHHQGFLDRSSPTAGSTSACQEEGEHMLCNPSAATAEPGQGTLESIELHTPTVIPAGPSTPTLSWPREQSPAPRSLKDQFWCITLCSQFPLKGSSPSPPKIVPSDESYHCEPSQHLSPSRTPVSASSFFFSCRETLITWRLSTTSHGSQLMIPSDTWNQNMYHISFLKRHSSGCW